MTNLALVISDISVRQDSDSRYCLNDLHSASGNEQKHRPKYFLENQQTKNLISVLKEEGGIPPTSVIRGIGTYSIKEIVYAYAMWISPEFSLKVIRAYDGVVDQLLKPRNALVELPLFTPAQKQHLKVIIGSLSRKTGKSYAYYYNSVFNQYNVNKSELLKSKDYQDICTFLGAKPKTFEGELLPKESVLLTAPQLSYKNMPYTETKDYSTAESRLGNLREWAVKNDNEALITDIDAIKRCLVSAWTEIDEALFRFEHGVSFLKRWRNK